MTDPLIQAAAFHGLATNQAYPAEERLGCALQALELYETEVERVEPDDARRREQRALGYREAIADLRAEADRHREQSTVLWAVFASGADFLESRLNRPAGQITEPPIPPEVVAVRDHEGDLWQRRENGLWSIQHRNGTTDEADLISDWGPLVAVGGQL